MAGSIPSGPHIIYLCFDANEPAEGHFLCVNNVSELNTAVCVEQPLVCHVCIISYVTIHCLSNPGLVCERKTKTENIIL